jgi:hypothetical protein
MHGNIARMLKTIAVASVIAGSIGCVWAMDADDDPFDFKSPPLSPRTEEITQLRYAVDWAEVDAAYKAYDAGRAETDPEKAYQLFRIALGGTGKSEYSKKFNALVDDNIKRFIENDELFVGKMGQIKKKLLSQKIDFALIQNKSIVGCCGDLSNSVSELSLSHASIEKDKAVRFQKESIFWGIFDVIQNPDSEEYLTETIRQLWRLE